MSIDRKQMDKELKAHCVPFLRELGFKGSFPNLYRDSNGFISLINFQYFSSGGSLCLNLGYADPTNKLTVSQTREQVRLGSKNLVGDNWFSFGKTSYGEYRGDPIPPNELVARINMLIENQAEPWWKSKKEQSES